MWTFDFSVNRLVSRRRHSISTMSLSPPASSRTGHPKFSFSCHNYLGNHILDNDLNSCIFVELGGLWKQQASFMRLHVQFSIWALLPANQSFHSPYARDRNFSEGST